MSDKKLKDLSQTEKTAIILQSLQVSGYNQYQAAQLLNTSKAWMYQVNKKIEKGLLDQKLIQKAQKSVKKILEGKAVGDSSPPKASDVLQAAKMVLDRAEPVTIKTENTNISIDVEITQEDRNRYKKLLGVVDAEYEVVDDSQKLLEHVENDSTGNDTKTSEQ